MPAARVLYTSVRRQSWEIKAQRRCEFQSIAAQTLDRHQCAVSCANATQSPPAFSMVARTGGSATFWQKSRLHLFRVMHVSPCFDLYWDLFLGKPRAEGNMQQINQVVTQHKDTFYFPTRYQKPVYDSVHQHPSKTIMD